VGNGWEPAALGQGWEGERGDEGAGGKLRTGPVMLKGERFSEKWERAWGTLSHTG